MNTDKDTVIGSVFNDCCNPDVQLSDLDDEYQERLMQPEGLMSADQMKAALAKNKHIAELEAKVAAQAKALDAADTLEFTAGYMAKRMCKANMEIEADELDESAEAYRQARNEVPE